jgi:pyrroloquinoline quinone biosynthesis protein B
LAWAGDPRVKTRTQSSLAVSADGKAWCVINASPDIRQQISASPALHPKTAPRHSPIASVLLTNGDVDHVAGLLSLRERQAFALFGTKGTLDLLDANRIFGVLSDEVVRRTMIAREEPFVPVEGVRAVLFGVPGKIPLWLEEGEPAIGAVADTTVGVILETGRARIAYVPGCAEVTADLRRRIDGVDALLFDGTVFQDDELIARGVGTKTGRRMGHVAMRGAIAALADVKVGRRIFVHINNTNPALIEGSAERAEVERAGWTIAHDGLTVTL